MSTEKSTPERDRISADRTKMDSHLFRLFVSTLLIPAKCFGTLESGWLHEG